MVDIFSPEKRMYTYFSQSCLKQLRNFAVIDPAVMFFLFWVFFLFFCPRSMPHSWACLCRRQGCLSSALITVGNCSRGSPSFYHRRRLPLELFRVFLAGKSIDQHLKLGPTPLSQLRGYRDLAFFSCSLVALQPLTSSTVSNTGILIQLWLDTSPAGRSMLVNVGWK